jgi:hypothetical protein
VDGASLDFGVEKRFPWLADDAVFGQHDELVEEGLVGDTPQ